MPDLLSNDELQAHLKLIQLVRLNITDTAADPAARLFTDEQLGLWLDLFGGSVNRATYRALITIATSEVLVSKKIRTQSGTSTDGPAVSAELRALAAIYKAEAEAEDAEAPFFEIVPLYAPDGPEVAEYRW